jgi:hypothetical protein
MPIRKTATNSSGNTTKLPMLSNGTRKRIPLKDISAAVAGHIRVGFLERI